ncbi:MAG: CHAT domain-containing protein [Bacillota bacterium]
MEEEPLAVKARAFVRVAATEESPGKSVQTLSSPVRILLVISRPAGEADLPFRAVANGILSELSAVSADGCDVHVLPVSTFAAFSRALREAKAGDKPFHVVHFDGHGEFMPDGEPPNAWLMFEGESWSEGMKDLRDAVEIAEILRETGVSAFIMNACRSGDSAPAGQSQPADIGEIDQAARSVAAEVADRGIAVIAMRYRVWAPTVGSFMSAFYRELVRGSSVGESVAAARGALLASAERALGRYSVPFQDWFVPVVYEPQPLMLFLPGEEVRRSKSLETAPGGMVGRETPLLMLTRWFAEHSVIHLRGFTGAGKTTLANEFSRWWGMTSGLHGWALTTDFDGISSLEGVLNHFRAYHQPKGALEWSRYTLVQRRVWVLSYLRQHPGLWVWDHADPVLGLFSGEDGGWRVHERRALRDFLAEVLRTGSRVLLVSCCDMEEQWTDLCPIQCRLLPMDMVELVQLVDIVAGESGHPAPDVRQWRDLLASTSGNPLVARALISYCLNRGLFRREQVAEVIRQLRRGDPLLMRSVGAPLLERSLAILRRGMTSAFSEAERQLPALLIPFRGYVVDALLEAMSAPGGINLPPLLRELTPSQCQTLLDRGARCGLLLARGDTGLYDVHPLLPQAMQPFVSDGCLSPTDYAAVIYQYTRHVAQTGADMEKLALKDERASVHYRLFLEPNLVHALELSIEHGWTESAISSLLGLRRFYQMSHQTAEWDKLLDRLRPDLIDVNTGNPRAGYEDEWIVFSQFEVHRLIDHGDLFEAEALLVRLLRRLEERRQNLDYLEPHQRFNTLSGLPVVLFFLGLVELRLGRAGYITTLNQALVAASEGEGEGENDVSGVVCQALGDAHASGSTPDHEEAKRWYLRSLERLSPGATMHVARSQMSLGDLAVTRLQSPGGSAEDLSEAFHWYNKMLQTLGHEDFVLGLRGKGYHKFGRLLALIGANEKACECLRWSITDFEAVGDIRSAALVRQELVAIRSKNRDRVTGGKVATWATSETNGIIGSTTTRSWLSRLRRFCRCI